MVFESFHEQGFIIHMIFLFGALTLFYLINGVYYFWGIQRLSIRMKGVNQVDIRKHPFVSIIVPARNEVNTITRCLNCLMKQDYPGDRFEIIPVNDASKDGTLEVIVAAAGSDSRIRPVHILSEERAQKGKIHAIDQGIQKARGEIIITTDADVWMGPHWINSMVHAFSDRTGLIMGITLEEFSGDFIHAFQALDGAGIRVIAAALAEMNNPITCQGSNLAFRREVYFQVRESVLTLGITFGNREWLMQEIDIATDWEIHPQLDPDSFAYTTSTDTWSALINQRSRWASTGKNYTKFSVRVYLYTIYFTLFSFILGFFILTPNLIGLQWVIKLCVDLSVALAVVRVLQQQKLLFAFPLVFILQPLMVVITAFMGTFGLYRWK